VIVVGEQYARHGLDRVLDTFTRLPESRYNSYFVTAYGTTAKEILSAPYQLELIPSVGLNKILASNVSFPVKIDEFLDTLSMQGKSPVTPAVRIIHKGTSKETFTVDRAAAYRANKLAGFMTPEELRLLRWWTGESKRMRFSVQAEPADEQFAGIIGAELLQSSSKIHISMKNGLPEVSISLHASTRSIDNDTRMDLSKISSMDYVEGLLSKQVQAEFEKMLSHAQKKLKADILGIGEEVHKAHPYVWKKMKKDWFNIYPNVPVTVKAHIKIERTGKTKAPAHLKTSS
jgi:spore germination protein KC